MADPLLTSLCTICHVQSPKYKCPRCATKTCSLACIKKHKNWSSCSGERDPTVYLPPSKLKTDAGIDHDYNFLTKIERSVEAAEKRFREERDILPPPGQGPQEQVEGGRGGRGAHSNKRARFNNGRGGDRHGHHGGGQDDNAVPTKRWDKNSQYRLRKLGIQVAAVPYGMTRSRENKTSWNKRTKTMNWQVEWFVWDSAMITTESTENTMDVEGDNATATPTQKSKPTRILHKILDEVPIAEGFENSLSWFRNNHLTETERATEKSLKKKKNTTTTITNTTNQHISQNDDTTFPFSSQDSSSTTWSPHPTTTQSPTTGSWSIPLSTSFKDPAFSISSVGGGKYQFFYHIPRIPSRQTQKLRPLAPGDNLACILPGLNIVEFPAIHVLPVGLELPEGYILDQEEARQFAMRPRPPVVMEKGEREGRGNGKRKADELVGYGSSDEDENEEDEAAAADTTSSEEESSGEEESEDGEMEAVTE